MPRIKLKGMAWDHRRAIGPLLDAQAAFVARHP
jgi:hypothetical protein